MEAAAAGPVIAGASKRHAHVTQEDLRQQMKEGFQCSAYRGVSGAVEAIGQEDEVTIKDNLRFAAMISNALDPYPMPKVGCVPKGLGKASYTQTSAMNHKTHTFRNGEEMAGTLPPFEGERHSIGRVPNGLRHSCGFMETMSLQKAEAERACFDEGVMRAYEEGRQRERAAEQERIRLQHAPFESAEPAMFEKSSQEHCNLSTAARHHNVAVTIHNSASRQRQRGTGGSADETTNGGAPHAAVPPRGARRETAEEAALLETLHKMREESKPRRIGRAKPGASGWCSTAREHFDSFDAAAAGASNERNATQPLCRRNQVLSEEDLRRVAESDNRFAHRFDNYETECSAKLRDRHAEAEVDHTHGVKGFFNIRNGVHTISSKTHHPRDVCTGETYGTSQVVQGQFCRMSSNPLPMRD